MPGAEPGACPICGRPLPEGAAIDRHHWIPRTHGGRESAVLHVVCHRMIHRLFDETALATRYRDAQTIRDHPEMARFIRWVRRKPPDFVDWPRTPRRRRPRRR